ncbi:hypothetical protein OAM69_04150 [bacterium]|nr:hypothetical protein [bacterium]
MIQRLLAFIAIITLYVPSGIASAQNVYHLESGGLVMMESETDDNPEGWTFGTAIEGYTGIGYLEWTGPNYFQKANAGNGVILYNFQIFTAGNYELRWRSRIALGESATEHNDSWVRLATGENIPEEHPIKGWTKVYMNQLNSWTWQASTVDFDPMPIRQYFEIGNHTVEISGRSAGHTIDRIALQRYEDVSLTDNELDQAPASQTSTEPFNSETADGESCNGADNPASADGAFDSNSEVDNTSETNNNSVGDGISEDHDISDEDSCTDPDPANETDSEPEIDGESETVTEIPEPGIDQAALAEEVGEHPVGACLDNRLILGATKDAYILDGQYVNTDELQVDEAASRSLLIFSIEYVPTIVNAELYYSLTSNTSANGTLHAYLASHGNWPEDGPALDTPGDMLLIGREGNYWVSDKRYALSLDPTLLPANQFTIALQMAAGSDSLHLASSESTSGMPLLVLEGDEDFCSAYEVSKSSDSQLPATDVTDGVDTPTQIPPTTDPVTGTIDPVEKPSELQPPEELEQPDNALSGGSVGIAMFSALLLIFIRRKRYRTLFTPFLQSLHSPDRTGL